METLFILQKFILRTRLGVSSFSFMTEDVEASELTVREVRSKRDIWRGDICDFSQMRSVVCVRHMHVLNVGIHSLEHH